MRSPDRYIDQDSIEVSVGFRDCREIVFKKVNYRFFVLDYDGKPDPLAQSTPATVLPDIGLCQFIPEI